MILGELCNFVGAFSALLPSLVLTISQPMPLSRLSSLYVPSLLYAT